VDFSTHLSLAVSIMVRSIDQPDLVSNAQTIRSYATSDSASANRGQRRYPSSQQRAIKVFSKMPRTLLWR
ncbi:MAG: hypothetical protein ACREQK_14750, partial [Candidatus Binatia bacterium]